MVHFVITYANEKHSRFDFDYYMNTHLPMGNQLLKDYGLVHWEVDRGQVNSRGEAPAFLCITRLYFADAERMTAGFAAHGAELKADIGNYTNVDPVFTQAETVGKSTG